LKFHLHHLHDLVLRDGSVRIPAFKIQEIEESLANGSLVIRRVHDDDDNLYEVRFNAVVAEEIERIWTSDLPNKLTRIYNLCGSREPVAVQVFLERVEMGDLVPVDLKNWTPALWNKILVDGAYHESTGMATMVLDRLVANGTLVYDCYDNYTFAEAYVNKIRKKKNMSLESAMQALACFDQHTTHSFMTAAGYSFNNAKGIFTRLDNEKPAGFIMNDSGCQ
jgi:hypothetical protein